MSGGKPAEQVSQFISPRLPEVADPLGDASETTGGNRVRTELPTDVGCTARLGSLARQRSMKKHTLSENCFAVQPTSVGCLTTPITTPGSLAQVASGFLHSGNRGLLIVKPAMAGLPSGNVSETYSPATSDIRGLISGRGSTTQATPDSKDPVAGREAYDPKLLQIIEILSQAGRPTIPATPDFCYL